MVKGVKNKMSGSKIGNSPEGPAGPDHRKKGKSRLILKQISVAAGICGFYHKMKSGFVPLK